MAIYKNNNGTWYVMIRYQDWTGARKQKCKRGFATRKEAADWELQFKLQKKASLDMTMESFCALYEEDVRPSLKQSTWLTKENIIQKKILPYLGQRKVSEITAKDVMDWHNQMRKLKTKTGKYLSPTYLKTIHGQLSTIFNHAVKYYDLSTNPARKAGALGTEDGLGDTIKPRLLAAGADCSKVLVIDDTDQPLTMADIRLEEAIIQTKARMVVLDPIQGFLGAEVDMHRANEIRPLMKRIAVLAEKYHCAIILIGHMNKNSNGKSSYRGLGSIDFQAAARSVLIVGRIKEEPETRVVCHTKSSLAPEGKSIAFRLDKDNGFEWIGEYDISADELLNGDGKGQKSRKAKEFLLEILADGGMSQKKILEEAAKRGIKGKTLRNAKSELEVDSIKRGNQWYWVLPE